MWRFKPFMQKEATGLEGRYVDVGNLKIQIRNAIAEGGFSCVYLARDALSPSKQYALKHMVCNDEESLELVNKEIHVMKSLKGHPNVVSLLAHAILDMGRTKEALLVMEFCDKSLVTLIDSRGATAFFEEKQILSIFRDVCNAVFAMHCHCQSPPIAHRDLKAENLLLGSDGSWKLCDFGSSSTNHKRFEKPEEMGIEEDNIRKHTTPAYRAPEMWDLFRRDLISEKVDIWALGCLLFRICYFKNAFDGESKLQILNGNYRIPDVPKYSSVVTDLIRDMLQASPDDRPDITQVWFRVNEQLPANLQKLLPDRPPEMQSTVVHEGASKTANRSPPMPHRSPPPPPSSGVERDAAQLGVFWSTQHAKESVFVEEKSRPKFDEEPINSKSRSQPENNASHNKSSPLRDGNAHSLGSQRNVKGKSNVSVDGLSKDFEVNFFSKDVDTGMEKPKVSKADGASLFGNESFDTFVADFDNNKLKSGVSNISFGTDALEAEVERLKEQLKQANFEKAEVTSKFEKLSAICRSQRQEINELKQVLAARTPSPNKSQVSPRIQSSVTAVQEKPERNTPGPEPKQWQAFSDDPEPFSDGRIPRSVRSKNVNQKKHGAPLTSDFDSWGFETERFSAAPAASGRRPRPTINSEGMDSSQYSGGPKAVENQPATQPAGWAGF
ncbi:hypothetical protein K2173_012351 [Erythroxylum novogranatense]|uniref:non-specific serine/threonine protein kinase n=1 Tax=Erythroxylum novogranatense TaxID=1862640 RepID=A0AAV8U9L3_9ROSI|nr:hypothetical protein K2173_012351 [Erythroxylum novogranatense]